MTPIKCFPLGNLAALNPADQQILEIYPGFLQNSLMKKTHVIVLLLFLCLAYVYGVMSFKFRILPYPQITSIFNALKGKDRLSHIFRNTSHREKTPCVSEASEETMVLVVIGQSGAANTGDTQYSSNERVLNFFEGECYMAVDPLLGATYIGGSIWTRFGDLVIKEGLYNKVVIVPVAVGGTTAKAWAHEKELKGLLNNTVKYIKAKGMGTTHVFYMQGEADTLYKTTQKDYEKHLKNLIGYLRTQGIVSPVWISITTRVNEGVSQHIREAQKNIIDSTDNVFAGPDTDTVDGREYRYDGVHFSGKGMDRLSTMWLESIRVHVN